MALFAIKQKNRELYWNCSTEHGTGWNPHEPKQSFSKSELSREIFNIIDRGYFVDLEILELNFAP